MELMNFIKLCTILTYLQISESAWTLKGSSSVGVVGEAFTLTCTPDTYFPLVQWRRNNVVIAYTGSGCTPATGADTSYTYACGDGLVRILTIPASSMTSAQHNTVWSCGDVIGGTLTGYTLSVQTPVSDVIIQGEPGYPDVSVVYEHVAKTFTCVTSRCYPKANVTVAVSGASNQINGETYITDNNGLYITSRSFTITAVRADQGKIIMCVSENIQGRKPVSESKTLDVYYPPTAHVVVPNGVTENDVNVEIVCNITSGVPATNTFHGWSQYIGGTLMRSGLNGTSNGNSNELVFPLVTLDDIGEYKCEADNGIKGRQHLTMQSASEYFDVNVSAKFNSNARHQTAEQNKDATLSFPFYSNPHALSNDIKWTNESNGVVLIKSSSVLFDLINAKVKKQIHNKTVSLDGQIAKITFKPFRSHYVGNYAIAVTDGGSLTSSFIFKISASAPPDNPSNVRVYDITAYSITLRWIAGFNGGHPQTFVVLYSNSGNIFEKTIEERPSQTNYTYTVDNLNQSTKYQFWLFAKNIKGNSSLFFEAPLEARTAEAATITGVIDSRDIGVAGTLGAVIAIVGIVIGVKLYRRRNRNGKRRTVDNNGRSAQEYADLISTRDNNLYDRCNDRTNNHVYENQSLTSIEHQNDNAQGIGEINTYDEVGTTGGASYNNSTSPENKYENLRRVSERNTYEGITVSENAGDDKVYYVNAELNS